MNGTAYIFGNLGAGYTQYPDDSLDRIFMTAEPKGESGISIRRDSSMAWCIYRRNLSGGRFIGLAIGFNGVCCSSIEGMFEIFESALVSLALEGRLIGFAEDGELMSLVSKLYLSRPDVNRISESLCLAFDSLETSSFCQLPPFNYGSADSERKELTYKSGPFEVEAALAQVNAVDIPRGERLDPLDSYVGKLRSLHEKNEALEAGNASLRADLKKVERQNKRTTLVTCLVILIALIFTIFMKVSVNLNDEIYALNRQTREMEQAIEEKDARVVDLQNAIQTHLGVISELRTTLREIEEELSAEKTVNASLSRQNDQLETQVSSYRNDLQTLSEEVRKLNAQLSSEKADKAKWISYYNGKAGDVTKLEKQVSELKAQINTLQQQAANRRRR